MPRQPRYALPGVPQHVLPRGNNRQPVRAAMVVHPATSPWSSYRWHACGEPDPVITDHDLYQALGHTPYERQVAYRAMFHPEITAGVLQEIRTTVHQCRVLGTERFKDVIERVLARRIRPGQAGRPRKVLLAPDGA